MAVIWVEDEDECVDYLSQAKDSLGIGENKIDETWNGHVVGTYATREFDLRHDHVPTSLTSPYGFPSSSVQRIVQDAWIAAGCKYDEQGFCKLNDCYLIACTSVFGSIGDRITFYFDDGTSVDCIKIDAKAEEVAPWDPTPATKWGHDDGRCVLEFCGQDRIGDNPYLTLGKDGRRTTSWTNHGAVVDVGSGLGESVSQANSAKKSSKRGLAASAMADCAAEKNYDNSTLVSALVSYSYSQRRVQSDSEPSTALYQEVCEAVFGTGDVTASYHYHSCDRGVAAAIRWTGADAEFPAGDCSAQDTWCHEHPELWKEVASGVSIDGDDDWAEKVGLEPGDVGFTSGNGGHTVAYVGNAAIQEGYEQFVKGHDGTSPGTGGDIGEPAAGSSFVMASAHQRGACMQNGGDDRTYTFYRYIGDYPDKDKYADVGDMAAISGASSKSTACDCGEEAEDKSDERADSLIYIQQSDGKSHPDPHGSTNVHMTCDPVSITHATILLTGDYSLTPNKAADMLVDAYGEAAAYSGYETLGGNRSANIVLLRRLFKQKYDLCYQKIELGPNAIDEVRKALLEGHMVVAGATPGFPDGTSDGTFAKPEGNVRVHPVGHTIMFYKYANNTFWGKDSASDGGAMCPYKESSQGGRSNYAEYWFSHCSYLTEYWIGTGGMQAQDVT